MKRDIRVLFVEDDPASVELMLHALRVAGFHPEHIRVDSAREFEVALKDRPDVIIADYYVPDFYGIDVLYLMDHCGLDIPVIVVSAALPVGSEEQILRLGATAYVRKDELGRLGKAVYDAISMRKGVCHLSDREYVRASAPLPTKPSLAGTRGLV
ncbi:MAG: hypothetical protein Kow0056_14520 [Coriobacteriia bacterium]